MLNTVPRRSENSYRKLEKMWTMLLINIKFKKLLLSNRSILDALLPGHYQPTGREVIL